MSNDKQITSIKATSTIEPTYPIESDLALEEVKRKVTELLVDTELPDWAEFVSIDKDEQVFYRYEKPISYDDYWESDNEESLSYININGADWTKCCWKISDLLVNHLDGADYSAAAVLRAMTNPKPDTQPDWENLLSADEVKLIESIGEFHTERVKRVNRIIHNRLKPLLERIAELEAENQNLDIRFQLSEQYANKIQNQLLEAKAEIAELEAEKPNTIEGEA